MIEANSVNIFGHSIGIADTLYFSKFSTKALIPRKRITQDNTKLFFNIYENDEDSMSKINAQILGMTSGRFADFKQTVHYKEHMNE